MIKKASSSTFDFLDKYTIINKPSSEWHLFGLERSFMTTGIVTLAFAKRVVEPNPVNIKLAAITDAIDDELQQGGEPTVIVVQKEIELGIKHLRLETNLRRVVGQEDASNKDRYGNLYLDSMDVLKVAFEEFRAEDITDVIIIANPFLHLPGAKALAKKAGFSVMVYKIPRVGFDKSPLNLQWWCKGPIRLLTYLGLQVIGKLTRQNLHGIGEKQPN